MKTIEHSGKGFSLNYGEAGMPYSTLFYQNGSAANNVRAL